MCQTILGAHGRIRDYLLAVISDQTVLDAGSWFGGAKGVRNKADYNLQDKKVEGANTTALFLVEARKHFDGLKAAFTGANLLTIQADLRAYDAKMKGPSR